MKKYIISSVMALLLVIPTVSLAQSDVDTSGDASCAIISVNLRFGSRDASTGGAVSILQDFLNSRGYLASQPTGFFGSMTRTAVAHFQSDNGISATPPGFMGPTTRARIQTIDCGAGANTTTQSATNTTNNQTTTQSTTQTTQSTTPSVRNNLGNGGQTYSIGNTVVWTNTVTNVPSGSTLCNVLIRLSDNHNFAFPPEGACRSLSITNGDINVTGTLVSNASYNLTSGQYRLKSTITGRPSGAADGPLLAEYTSGAFTLNAQTTAVSTSITSPRVTSTQSNSIHDILVSFGANGTTINNVGTFLSGGAAPTTNVPSYLTNSQVQSILSLLSSFGASSATIATVNTIISTGVTTSSPPSNATITTNGSVLSSGGTITIPANGSATLGWNSNGGTSCTLTGSGAVISSSPSGSMTITNGNVGNYTYTCSGMNPYYFSVAATPTATVSAPDVSTVSATTVYNAANGTASVTLNGSANPNGSTTTGWFRGYGSYYQMYANERCTNNFGVASPFVPSLGSGTSPVAYSSIAAGLPLNTTYYYCAAASNAGGTGYGYIQSITTASAPAAAAPAPTAPVTSYYYPTLSLSANGSPVYDGGTFQATGGTVAITWGSTSATSCTLNSTTIPTSGSQTLSGVTTSTNIYTCVNSAGSSALNTSLRFTVLAVPLAAPTIQLYQVGSTLEWHAYPDTSPTSCVYNLNSGAWMTLTPLNGSLSLSGLSSGTYTVNAYCTRDGVTGPTKTFTYTVAMNSTQNSTSNQMASALSAFSSAMGGGTVTSTAGFSYTWNRDLQVGSPYTADVIALQTALAREGVYAGEITGGFYNQTFIAVQAFQQRYGIATTGFVGPTTRAKLNALY